MLRNFIMTSWRNLGTNKVYSLINILGLASGMAVAFLIGLWIWDEVSFDRSFARHQSIAQLMTTEMMSGRKETTGYVSMMEAKALREKWGAAFSGFALATGSDAHLLSAGDKKVLRTGMWVEPPMPGMLTLHMQSGDREGLTDPSALLIDETTARMLFGDADAVGKTIRVDNQTDLRVAGIYEDLPLNTTFGNTHLFMPWVTFVRTHTWVQNLENIWMAHSFQAYVDMAPGVDESRVSRLIRDFPKSHDAGEEMSLAPMDRWHLHGEYENGVASGGLIRFVWLFGLIGVFVLLLACINFMNLSTARSEKRAREVGIRKTLGSRRGQLVAQLFIESILVALLAWGVALILVSLALPFFNALSAKDISLPLRKTGFWALTLGFTLFTGLLAGSYPALYLSAFRPVKVLKGVTRAGRFAAAPRRVLVVLQFTVSVALIIGTLTVYRQVQYAKDRPVGYTRAGLITVDMNTPDIFGHYNALREDLLRTGAVTDMAQSSSLPTDISSVQSGLEWAGKDPRGNLVLGVVAVTHDYGKTIGWQVVQGRDFSRDYPTDTGAFVINEAAAKLMGFAHPVGQTVRWGPGPHKILGVVRDMVMDNPYDPAVPTVFVLNYNWAQEIIVRTPGPEALAKIAPVFQRYNPGSPFEYKFTDQEYDRKFAAEERIGHLAGVFAVLAIFISCLGLFGLAGYTAEQRTKEIGVRKVLGASLYSIWKLLSGEFVVLVLVSCLIAAPLSGYFLRGWLAHYVYRASLSWWIFAAAAAGALLITLATVSWQALRAGLANPVRSLRSE